MTGTGIAPTMSMSMADIASGNPCELEALAPVDRWTLEDRLGEAQGILREFNDEELRRWVEVERKTQTEIAEIVGQSQSQIQRRCARLGLVSVSNRGRPRITPTGNSDPGVEDRKEVPVEGDVDDDDLQRIAARIDAGELGMDEGRGLLWDALGPFGRYWLKHKGIVSGEERVEAIRETCEVAGVLPMIEDLTALGGPISYVWVGYVAMDGSEITGPLTFHPGWAHFCRDRLGEDVRFATDDLMPYEGPTT
jgi:hypothetical protein